MRLFFVFFCSAVLFGDKSSIADLFVYESFDYSSGTTLGQFPGTGLGFETGWSPVGRNSNTSAWRVQSGSLSYGSLFTNGNSVTAPSTTNDIYSASRQTSQSFAGESNGQTTYLSFLIRQYGSGGQFGGFGGIYVGNSTNEFAPKLFLGRGGNSNNWQIETLGGTGSIVSNEAIVVNQTALLVVKLETLAGHDRFTLFVNPTTHSEPTTGFVKNDLDLGIANRISMYHTGEFMMDEIRIGTTFTDVVTAVPEPSSALLLVICLSFGFGRCALVRGLSATGPG